MKTTNKIRKLFIDIDCEKEQEVKDYIDSNGDVNITCGATILHRAVVRSNKITDMLIKAGADVNIKDSDGSTPLHYAASVDFALNVKLLLDAKADLTIINNNNALPIHLAAFQAGASSVKLLLEETKDEDKTDEYFDKLLDYALIEIENHCHPDQYYKDKTITINLINNERKKYINKT